VPQILKVYRKIAERLTEFEDHASTRTHADALTRKTFALNSIVAYAGLTLSAFVYIPFGRGIMTGVDQKVYKRATGGRQGSQGARIDQQGSPPGPGASSLSL
jgi:anoctamin-10